MRLSHPADHCEWHLRVNSHSHSLGVKDCFQLHLTTVGVPEKQKDPLYQLGDSLLAQMVKNLPAVQETQVHSLGREDPLEKGIATPSSFLAWRIP